MTYTYDDAGNRASMQTAVSGGSNNTTNYSYNDYNRLTSDDSYWYSGTNDTGANTYTYDNNGNQTQRAFASGTQEWNYGWNADDRLTGAQWFTEYESEEWGTVTDWVTDNYEYDFAGRRIIEYQEQYLVMNATARTRSFFNGLTEEVRKQSVPNAHAQTAFGFMEKEDGVSSSDWSVVSSGTVTTQSDTPRRSSVIKVTSTSGGGGGAKHTSSDWNSTERVLSFWSKADSGWSPTLDVTISSSGGTGHVIYDNNSGSSTYHAPSKTATIHLNGGLGNTYWLRVERNIEADFESVSGATTWTNTDSVTYYPGGTSKNWYIDQIRLSNSYTSEQNILGPGVIGHILANRTWASPGASPTRTWFHYDQVGSVMATSDYNGSLIARKYQDAFGNRQAGWNGSAFSGLWSPAGGWQHNSKEVDGFTNLTYMYQRWYNSAEGRFMSRVRFMPFLEHQYSFSANSPVVSLDSRGTTIELCGSVEEEEQIGQWLEMMASTTEGGQIYDQLQTSENVHYISISDGVAKDGTTNTGLTTPSNPSAATDGTGSGTDIEINPNTPGVHPAEACIHECKHAADADAGMLDHTLVTSPFANPDDGATMIPVREERATITQGNFHIITGGMGYLVGQAGPIFYGGGEQADGGGDGGVTLR